jgi:hypothetical protein
MDKDKKPKVDKKALEASKDKKEKAINNSQVIIKEKKP